MGANCLVAGVVGIVTTTSCESKWYLNGWARGEPRRPPEAVTRSLVLLMNESSMYGRPLPSWGPSRPSWRGRRIAGTAARRGASARGRVAPARCVWACECVRCAGAQECGPTHPLPMTACKGRFFNAGLVSSHPGRSYNEPEQRDVYN